MLQQLSLGQNSKQVVRVPCERGLHVQASLANGPQIKHSGSPNTACCVPKGARLQTAHATMLPKPWEIPLERSHAAGR
jgi:hypothetical protein